MKKILFVLICALLACTLLSACDVPEGSEIVDVSGGEAIKAVSFEAKVLEIAGDKTILVSPDASSNEAKSSDKISVGVMSNSKFKVGDTVRIYYGGEILESYPAQLADVYRIEKLDENGNVIDSISVMKQTITQTNNDEGAIVYEFTKIN